MQGRPSSALPPPQMAPVPAHDPALVADATVAAREVSVWFGQKVALSHVTCSFGPGVTGLLGPNGAGKTTLMRAITGMSDVNQGSITVAGRNPRRDRRIHRQVALVPEDEAVPAALTLRQFVTYVATLHRIADRHAVERAIATVALTDAAHRRIDGFSKGMRQRSKIAAALVTDPTVLVLDEPLNGADPVQRVNLIALFKRLGAEGLTVIVSSHVLAEVERMAERVIVIVNGRLAAAGDRRAIRDAMDDRPRHLLVRSGDDRALAAALMRLDAVTGVNFNPAPGRAGSGNDNGGRARGPQAGDGIVVQTQRAGDVATALAGVARDEAIRLHEVRPLDDSLESLFRELVR